LVLLLVLPVVAQICLFALVLRDGIVRRVNTRKRIDQIQKIIPEIEIHPNPILSDLFWTMGTEMMTDSDRYIRLVGVCLKNYYTLLDQEIKKDYLKEKGFIEIAQHQMKNLEDGLRRDDKRKLAECLFGLSRLLFEYPSTEENAKFSEKLKKTLLIGADYLRRRGKAISSNPELDLFRFWDFASLSKADPYLRFVYIHTVRWCSQLPFEYKISRRVFSMKSAVLAQSVGDSVRFAKNKDLLSLYITLCDTYSSLFPRNASKKLTAEEIFFTPKSSIALARERFTNEFQHLRKLTR
jgi:hypothetical protein